MVLLKHSSKFFDTLPMDRWESVSPPLNLGRLVSIVEVMLCEAKHERSGSFYLVYWDILSYSLELGVLSGHVRNRVIPGPPYCEEAQASRMGRPWIGALFGSLSWAQPLDHDYPAPDVPLHNSNLKWFTYCLWRPLILWSRDRPSLLCSMNSWPLGSTRITQQWLFYSITLWGGLPCSNKGWEQVPFSSKIWIFCKTQIYPPVLPKESSGSMNFWFEETVVGTSRQALNSSEKLE